VVFAARSLRAQTGQSTLDAGHISITMSLVELVFVRPNASEQDLPVPKAERCLVREDLRMLFTERVGTTTKLMADFLESRIIEFHPDSTIKSQ
jgi:hypothetical protein